MPAAHAPCASPSPSGNGKPGRRKQALRRGIGRRLWRATEAFAREAGFLKLAIQVRASNSSAQKFYRKLGFKECGRLTRQVIIDGVADDEVLMEFFLAGDSAGPSA